MGERERTRGAGLAAALMALVVVLCASLARAESDPDAIGPGTLDPTFGDGGLRTTNFGGSDSLEALATGPSGELIAAGDSFFTTESFAVARYDPNGSLDPAFSGDGKQRLAFEGSGFEVIDRDAMGVAAQPDGKIVVAGTVDRRNEWQFAVARLNPDGELDSSFSGDGLATTDVITNKKGEEGASAVLVQADGRIVAAGVADKGSSSRSRRFALVRYLSDGTLDPSFSGDGIELTRRLSSEGEELTGAALQADGKIIAVGAGTRLSAGFIVARYNSDGSLDSAFGDEGFTITHFKGRSLKEEGANAVALAPGGKIVVAGETTRFVDGGISDQTDFAIARYRKSGRLDHSFSEDGRVEISVGDPFDLGANAVVVQTNGRIVAAGSTDNVGKFALIRLMQSGKLDRSFGDRGMAATHFPGHKGEQVATALVLQDARIVAGGEVATQAALSENFALAGYER